MKKSVNLTKTGKAELETELKSLISRRPAIAERLATARAFGDLSENQEYSDARAEQKTVESRILEIEDILKNANVIRAGASRGKVTMGSVVEVKVVNKKQTFTIVGPVEANPLEGKISNESPIGKALMGRRVDEIAELKTPKGTTKYKILSIN